MLQFTCSFLIVFALLRFIHCSQDPFHYKGLGYIEGAEETSDCVVVATSNPVAASCLHPQSGNVKWQITFRKVGKILNVKAFERLSIFLFEDEAKRRFASAAFSVSGGILWELYLSDTQQQNGNQIFLDFDPSSSNLITILQEETVTVIENALSSQPEVTSANFVMNHRHFHPSILSTANPNNLILGTCISLKDGTSSQIVFATDKKQFQHLSVKTPSLPIFRTALTSNRLEIEVISDSQVKAKSSVDLVELVGKDASILTSDFFFSELDGILIPTLYLRITGLSFANPIHLILQAFKQENRYDVTHSVHVGQVELVKSHNPNHGNVVKDFSFVQLLPSELNEGQATDLFVSRRSLSDRLTLISLKLPLAFLPFSHSRIFSVSTPKSLHRKNVLLTLRSGLVVSVDLGEEQRRGSSAINWIRNDGLSRLQQPHVLHASVQDYSATAPSSEISVALNQFNLQKLLEHFTRSSQYENCDLSRSVLAISLDEQEKSFAKTGLAVHLIAVKPKFCGNIRIHTWKPMLSNLADDEIILERVKLLPKWDSSHSAAVGFYLIVPTKSGRALIWDETFDNFFQIQSSFQWTADSLENQIVNVLPTRDILLDANLIGALASNVDLNIILGDSNDHHKILSLKERPVSAPGYFYSVNHTSGTVLVEKFVSSQCEGNRELCLQSSVVAKLEFDSRLEEIVLLLRPNDQHAFSNRATTLGDDNILLNYINPNLAVICTKSMKQKEGTRRDESDSTLFIHIIDIVSGKILHRVSHENVELPIRGVIIENFVLISYWNSKAKRGEISSIGLYDGFIGKNDFTPFGTESKAAKTEDHPNFYKVGNVTKRSSFLTSAPLLMQRTYAFTRGITDLTQTISSRGINNKNLLIAFDSGHLSSIDFRALSPRRPLSDPTVSEREEGLLKYNPFITIMPTSILTRERHLSFSHSLNLLSTSAHLESESFVIAIGSSGDIYIDVFSPAQAFDSLSSDFNYLALCALLLGLLVAVLLLRHFNRKSTLNRLWH